MILKKLIYGFAKIWQKPILIYIINLINRKIKKYKNNVRLFK